MSIWIIIPVCLCLGFLIGFLVRYAYGKMRLTSIEQKAIRLNAESIREAELKKKQILLEGRDEIAKERTELDKEVRSTRSELQSTERRLQAKEESLDKKQTDLEVYKQTLQNKEIALDERDVIIKETEGRLEKEKERILGLSKEEIKKELVDSFIDEARQTSYKLVKKVEEDAALEGEKKARNIILECMQRLASESSSEMVSSVSLPSDEMKGRIIGREGRNIRSLEVLTGADIVIDDTPDAVVVSCFDPVRREIAKRSLEVLVSDGRIHPTRIEEVVSKTTKEIKRTIMEEGERVCMELGFNAMSPAMIRSLGRLHFRFSYSQNILIHSKECAYLASMIASEIGANVELAKRAALLHDIGKGADSESEEGHALYGAKLAKDLGESDAVVNAIASHHGDTEPKTIEAIIVQIADAISASRPGARNDNIDSYIKRLQNLENIATAFDGVEKAFAIQAGRELRIIVDNTKVSDEKAHEIAKNIAKRIEAELNYPGKIRITLIRETRVLEYAL